MAGTFPISLPGLQVDMSRETVYQNSIDVSQAGIEVRTNWHSTPRYRYSLSIIGRTEASEVDDLTTFLEDQRGEWDTFTLVDPLDGTSRTCRFESAPSFRTAGMPGWWMMSCKLISVI